MVDVPLAASPVVAVARPPGAEYFSRLRVLVKESAILSAPLASPTAKLLLSCPTRALDLAALSTIGSTVSG